MKLIKTREGLALLLPESVIKALGAREGLELEIKHISGKVFAFFPRSRASQTGVKEKREARRLEPEAMSVLRKLNRIRFSDRTEKVIKKEFTKEELKVLEDLVSRGVVLKMTGGKYKSKGGVYSISKDYYPLLSEEREDSGLESLEKQLVRDGYLVIKDEKLAEDFAEFISDGLNTGKYLGIKGFDKAYYFVTQQFLSQLGNRIRKTLESGPLSIEELAGRLGKEPMAVKAVIEILRESGEVIEKKKGVYALA